MPNEAASLCRLLMASALLVGASACRSGPAPAAYPSTPTSYAATPDRRAGERVAFVGHGVNPREDTRDKTTSTFGIDVDDASFNYVKAELAAGRLPDPSTVRVEEFVNHFDYPYPTPRDAPFALLTDAAPSPFEAGAHIVRFAVQAGAQSLPGPARPRRIVFAIDTSGSMREGQRASLAKYCMQYLVDRLAPDDVVAIVAFADQPRVVLAETPASERKSIWNAVQGIRLGGVTNVVRGLDFAYGVAGRSAGGRLDARVVLISDGLANQVDYDTRAVENRIFQEAEAGVRLSVVGVGQASYGDTHLERLARLGSGRYSYVSDQDDINAAFGFGALRSLPVVAEHVRLQVEFDPKTVRSWRQLGYESRWLANEHFEEAAWVGAHLEADRSVTALYEIRLHEGARGALATLRMTYRDPHTRRAEKRSAVTLRVGEIASSFEEAAPDFRLAVCAAETAERLRRSIYTRERTFEHLLTTCDALRGGPRHSVLPHAGPSWLAAEELHTVAQRASELEAQRRLR